MIQIKNNKLKKTLELEIRPRPLPVWQIVYEILISSIIAIHPFGTLKNRYRTPEFLNLPPSTTYTLPETKPHSFPWNVDRVYAIFLSLHSEDKTHLVLFPDLQGCFIEKCSQPCVPDWRHVWKKSDQRYKKLSTNICTQSMPIRSTSANSLQHDATMSPDPHFLSHCTRQSTARNHGYRVSQTQMLAVPQGNKLNFVTLVIT